MCVCVRVCVCVRARACVCNVPTWSARTADNCFSWKGKSTTARSLSKRACGLTSSNLYASVCVCMDHIQTCMHASHVCMRACTLMPVGADTHTHTHTHTHIHTRACMPYAHVHARFHTLQRIPDKNAPAFDGVCTNRRVSRRGMFSENPPTRSTGFALLRDRLPLVA